MNYGSLYLCEGPLRAMFCFLHFNGRCSDSVNFGPKYPIIQYCLAVDDKFCDVGPSINNVVNFSGFLTHGSNTIHRQFWLISDTVVYGRSLWVLWDWIRCLHFIWSRSIYQVFKQSISTVRCKSLWFIGMFQDEKAVKVQKSGRNYNHGIGEATTWNHLRFEFLLPHSN